MLVETDGGRLVHMEYQSANDGNMAYRMFDYGCGIRHTYGRFPHQIALFVGPSVMRMETGFAIEGFRFEYQLVDIRDLDGAQLLASPYIEDNILAILTKNFDNKETVHTVIERIAVLENSRQVQALRELTALAGLRKLGSTLKQEAARMPIIIDIRDNEILFDAYKNGLQEGRDESKKQQRDTLERLLEFRFGPLPTWAKDRIRDLSSERTEALTVRAFEWGTLEDVLPASAL